MKPVQLILLGLLGIFLLSCVNHEAEAAKQRDQLVSQGVLIKISEFKEHESEKCLEQARTIAIAKADSIIRALAKQEAVEPVQKPPKPERPVKPELKTLPDSVLQKGAQTKDTIRR